MHILTVSPDRYVDHLDHLTQMHQLRAKVFSGRLAWDVTITDAGERDEYDYLDPTYVLAVTDSQIVVGCARLLPSLGTTMLEQTFPQLLATGSLNASAHVVESSRFCVDTTLATERGGGSFISRRS